MHRKKTGKCKKSIEIQWSGKKSTTIFNRSKEQCLVCTQDIFARIAEKKTHRNKRYTIQNAQFPLILCNGLGCFISFFLFLDVCIQSCIAFKHTPLFDG